MITTERTRTALAAVLAAAVLAALAPWPARLGPQRAGDPALAREAARLAGQEQRRGLAVAVLDDGMLRTAGVGQAGPGRPVRPDTPFQAGSVTKTFTGALLADLAAAGVVRPDDRLAELLPGRSLSPEIGRITLAELAGHRSGLPRLRLTVAGWARATWSGVTGADPYEVERVDMVAEADAASWQTGSPGEYAYSNLGYALLGQVLAAKAGVPYPELLRTRLLDPLGLGSTTVGGGPPPGAATGHDPSGRSVQHWDNPSWIPAGSAVWSTAGDLARWAEATMHGAAPGADAARPRWAAGDLGEIGYGWMTTPTAGGGSVTWHNGGAGGHTAFVGFDSARGRVAAVLSDTEASVDAVGMALLGAAAPAVGDAHPGARELIIGVVLPLYACVAMLAAARGGWRRRPRRSAGRWQLLLGAVLSVFFLAVAAGTALPAWQVALVWPAAGALLGAAAMIAVSRWAELPWVRPRRVSRRAGSAEGSPAQPR